MTKPFIHQLTASLLDRSLDPQSHADIVGSIRDTQNSGQSTSALEELSIDNRTTTATATILDLFRRKRSFVHANQFTNVCIRRDWTPLQLTMCLTIKRLNHATIPPG